MATIKLFLGFIIIGMGGDYNSVVLVLGGTFLMIAGMNYVLPPIFDKIELYIMNKRDPDCNVIKHDALKNK